MELIDGQGREAFGLSHYAIGEGMCRLAYLLDGLAQRVDVGAGAVGIDGAEGFKVGRGVASPLVGFVKELPCKVEQVLEAVLMLEEHFVDNEVRPVA